MAKHMHKPVTVTSASDLMRLLDEADANSPVLLERHGVVYRLSTVESRATADEANEGIGDQPDADEIHRILDETVGSWADSDVDRMIEDIYRWRREGSRDPDAIAP